MEQRRLVRVVEAVARRPAGPLAQRLCDGAAAHLSIAGVALSLVTDAGLLDTLGTTEAGQVVESLQADLGEGPAYAAHAAGEPVLIPDLEDDTRWPAFGPAALAVGIRATFAFPLRRGAIRLGAMSLSKDTPGDLHPDQYADALVIARLAVDVGLALQDGHRGDDLADLFVTGTRHTTEIHQAAGMVSVQLGTDVGAALAVLRAHAYTTGRPLHAVAEDVVDRRLRLGPTI